MKKKERVIVFSIGIILLGVFTFTDLQISMTLYVKNLYGRIFEVIGELPALFLVLFGCVLLFRLRSRRNMIINVGIAALSGILLFLFALMGGFMVWKYLNENIGSTLPVIVPIIISLLLIVLAIFLAGKVPKENAHEAVTYAIISIIYFISILIVMNVIKAYWGRMRMREMTDCLAQFTPWYEIHSRGGFDNVYASFPSGHSMNSAAIILMTLLPNFMPGLAGKEKLLKIAAYTWCVIVGSSRIVMGAHFASDVVAGIMISLMLFEIIRTLVYKVRQKETINPISNRAKERR